MSTIKSTAAFDFLKMFFRAAADPLGSQSFVSEKETETHYFHHYDHFSAATLSDDTDSSSSSSSSGERRVRFAEDPVTSFHCVKKDKSKVLPKTERKKNQLNAYAMEDHFVRNARIALRANGRLRRLGIATARDRTEMFKYYFPHTWNQDTDKGDNSVFFFANECWEVGQNAMVEYYNREKGLQWTKSKDGKWEVRRCSIWSKCKGAMRGVLRSSNRTQKSRTA